VDVAWNIVFAIIWEITLYLNADMHAGMFALYFFIGCSIWFFFTRPYFAVLDQMGTTIANFDAHQAELTCEEDRALLLKEIHFGFTDMNNSQDNQHKKSNLNANVKQRTISSSSSNGVYNFNRFVKICLAKMMPRGLKSCSVLNIEVVWLKWFVSIVTLYADIAWRPHWKWAWSTTLNGLTGLPQKDVWFGARAVLLALLEVLIIYPLMTYLMSVISKGLYYLEEGRLVPWLAVPWWINYIFYLTVTVVFPIPWCICENFIKVFYQAALVPADVLVLDGNIYGPIPSATPVWNFTINISPINPFIEAALDFKFCHNCEFSGHVPVAARPFVYIFLVLVIVFTIYVYEPVWMEECRGSLTGKIKRFLLQHKIIKISQKNTANANDVIAAAGLSHSDGISDAGAAKQSENNPDQDQGGNVLQRHSKPVRFAALPPHYDYVDGSPNDVPGFGIFRVACLESAHHRTSAYVSLSKPAYIDYQVVAEAWFDLWDLEFVDEPPNYRPPVLVMSEDNNTVVGVIDGEGSMTVGVMDGEDDSIIDGDPVNGSVNGSSVSFSGSQDHSSSSSLLNSAP